MTGTAQIAVAVALAGSPVHTAAAVHPSCRDVTAKVTEFAAASAVPGPGWRENLGFDGAGGMWVSRVNANQVERFDPAGRLLGAVRVSGPGGIRLGPDGMLYVASGSSRGSSAIVRWNPRRPVPKVFASGLTGANGLTLDAAGNAYVSNPFAGITRVRRDGSIDRAWSARAKVGGANGLAIIGDTLYANRTTALASTIERVPLARPGAHRPAVALSGTLWSPVPKGLDDLTTDGAGRLYVVAFVTGELLRVDPVTRSACVLAGGLRGPTSVRRPYGFGSFDPAADLFLTEASGRLLHVRLVDRPSRPKESHAG